MSEYKTVLGNINQDEDGIGPTSQPESYRGIALMVVRDPKGMPVLAFDGNGRVVFHNMDYDHVVVDWDTKDSLLVALNQAVEHRPQPQVVVERDSDGEVTRLVCPSCGKDDIREYDRAERWNPIEIDGGTLAVDQQQIDFETVSLVCADCATELDAPQDVYEAMVWS